MHCDDCTIVCKTGGWILFGTSLFQISNNFQRYYEKSEQKSLACISSSEFHQLSGGIIFFLSKSCFKDKKGQQSGTNGNQLALKKRFQVSQLWNYFSTLKHLFQQK